jgi:hypothetical protein
MKNYYLKGRSIFILLAFIAATSSSLWSQVNGYSFFPLSGTYTPLVGGTATSLTATADDAISTAFPIGFNFVYGGVTYTQLRANSNGLLTFNATGTTTAANNLATATAAARPGLAPLWDDLQCSAGVTYQLNGIAPNRTLTVEWKNMEWNWSSSANAISFQVILYETSNIIDFIYAQGPDAGNPAGSAGASIGLMGVATTDYLSLQNSSASPTTSTTASTNNITVKPATGQIYRFINCPSAAPLTSGASTCSGSTAVVTATPTGGGTINWYDAATSGNLLGTGTTYTTPVLTATTSFYATETLDVCPETAAAEAIVSVNDVVVTLDPINESCIGYGDGSFALGTVNCGTAPFTYSIDGGAFGAIPADLTSGTYSVVAMDNGGLMSSPITLVVGAASSVIPASPIVEDNEYFICTGDVSQILNAEVPVLMETLTCTTATSSASGNDNTGVTATVTDFSCVPAGANVSNVTLAASIGTQCTSWYYYSIVVDGVTVATQQCNQAAFNLNAYWPFASVSVISADNPADNAGDFVTMTAALTFTYDSPAPVQPNYSLSWQDAASNGAEIGTGTSFESVGSSVMPAATEGSYNFYVSTFLDGCYSATSEMLTVNVSNVNAEIVSMNETCIGYSNGSFDVINITCGIEPFTYSVNGGAFGPIPTNLTAGSYDVVIQDNTGLLSPSIEVIIGVDATVVPPAPSVSENAYFICSGAPSQEITADVPVDYSNLTCTTATSSASGNDDTGVTATVTDFSCVPAGENVSNVTLAASIGAQCTAWYFYSIVVDGVTVATQQCNQAAFNLNAYWPFTSVSVVSADSPADGLSDFVTMTAALTFTYEVPSTVQSPYTIAWFDAPTGGSLVGANSPYETVGSSVMPASSNGAYNFYAATELNGCYSTSTEMVTVSVSDVLVELLPIDATCNGNNNGSFSLGAISCGDAPFTYSINGGAFGPIPTDLTSGTYDVVVMDNNGLISSSEELVIGQPSAPYNITVTNILYFTADVSWSTDGDEIQWFVEYGPSGFTPGSGTTVNASTTSVTLTGLSADTEYDVYVTADCGSNSTAGGPETFSTNQGFFTWDNMCPDVDFVDISATGTDLNLIDDGEAGLTMPIPFNYQGTDVTVLTVGNNGGIQLGTLTGNVGYGGNFNTLADGYIFPWGDDLDDETGNVYWEVIGTAPSQIFIVQWENSNNWSNGAGTVTFQVQFYEATNEIYFVYDDVVFGDSPADDFGGNADIGVSGPTDITVSTTSQTYLQNNSCVHFYNELCPNPMSPVVTTFQEEVIIDWTAGLYGETEWTVIYGPAGFDPTTGGTTLTTSAPSVNILGLTQMTNYDVYIYSECQADNLTSPGLLVEFQTLPWCNTPTGGTNATAVDSLFAAWNWTEVVGAPNGLSGFNIQYGMTGFELYNGTEVATGSVELFDTIADASFMGGGVYQYYVQAECGTDTSNYAGPFSFVMPLTTDSVCGAEMLMADGTVYTFNNAGATVGTGESAIAPGATGFQTQTGWGNSTLNNTTWYMFEAPASGNVRVNHNVGNTYAGQSAIYTVTDCGDYATFELVAANDNSMVNNAAAPNYTVCGLTPGATYYLLHDGNSATTGNHVISIIPINLNAGDYSSTLEVCTGGEVDLFDGITGNDAGGVWTAINAAAATQLTDNIWNSAGLAYNIPFEFEYRLTDGCAYDSVIALVEIFPLSSAGPDGSITVCRNEPVDLLSGLSGNVDLGGTWYDPSNQPLSNSEIVASNIPGQFNYDYVTGNGVCPDDTALVLVNVLSTCNYLDIQEMYFSDMTVHPNPSNAVFNVANFGSTEVFSYEVTDIDGRVITSKEGAINGTTTTEIDLKDKVTGVYFIKVYNENAEKTFKVVLQ